MAKGYRIIAEQPELEAIVKVDGESHSIAIRPDFLVKRFGKTWLVEVKTGSKAPNPLEGSTRRQLFEYSAANGGSPILLADMESHTIHRIEFPALQTGKGAALLAGASLAALTAAGVLLYFNLGPR